MFPFLFLVWHFSLFFFRSVDARQVIDLKLGVAFSRFQTRYFRANFGSQLGKTIRSPNTFFFLDVLSIELEYTLKKY